MDMLAIVVRRYKNGKSPFKPDRDHLHHILQRVGYSSRQTLVIISTFALLMSLIGVLGEVYLVPEYIMFGLFLVSFLIYSFTIKHIWKVVKYINRLVKTNR
jgi:UDP-GlcNAc:undecaprenyl-phosphate GlcNAc-1-phosphate transferase